MLTDLRFAFRMLLKDPVFTGVAVLVLALGIGGNTAMFSIVNALLFRPLEARHPEQLAGLYSREKKPEGGYRTFSYLNYSDIRQQNTVFTSLLAHQVCMVGLTQGEATRRTFAAVISANYFPTFGVRLAAGREFLPEEEKPGHAGLVAIVSHDYWRNTGFDPAVVGQSLRLNNRSFTIVGVAPEHFTGTAALLSPEVWLPLSAYDLVSNDFMNEQRQKLADRNHHCLLLVGRLKPGLTMLAAEPSLKALAAQLEKAYPTENKDQTYELAPLPRMAISTNPQRGSAFGTGGALLMCMSGVVLLIACLNLANMMLARGAARRKEIAIRTALGGGRGRIARQLLTEGLMMSLLGGALGLVLAYWLTDLLASSLVQKLSFISLVIQAAPDWRVLVATGGFCLVATLFFALGPALKLTRVDVLTDLKEHTGEDLRVVRGRRLLAPRNLLVVGQLALALAMITAAGLFTRGAINSARANPGFSLEHSLLVETDASLAGYDEAQARRAYLAVVERLRTLPGVESASLAYVVPFGLFSDGKEVQRAGQSANTSTNQASAETKRLWAGWNIVGTDYFKALGLPLLRGREFDRLETETTNAARVAIIDEPLAKLLWANEDAVGRSIQFGGGKAGQPAEVMQVVGVVAGVKDELGDKAVKPHVYTPFGQAYRSLVNFHVRIADRGAQGEAALLRAVRSEIRAVDDHLPVLSVQTLRDFHAEGLLMWGARTAARLFAAFGLLALFLAVVGVYGVKAYVVARRTREIGIRMALGATKGNVAWLVLREGIGLSALGLGVGLLLALGTGKVLSSLLYEVSAIDPPTFLLAPLLLAGATLLACYVPARHAARIAPMTALRCE